jgi:hypothetical protein
MDDRYCSSRLLYSTFTAVTLLAKAVGDVTAVRTVLPSLVTVCGELTPAMEADKCVDRFSVDLLEMRIPPLLTAGIRAEGLGLAARFTFYKPSAVLAVYDRLYLCAYAIQLCPTAERGNGINRDAEYLRNAFIATALPPVFYDFCFLLSRHKVSSSLRNVCPHYPLEEKSPFGRKTAKGFLKSFGCKCLNY